ncbi:MAG: hypothetical protein ACYC63_00730 [Armatimonadota bacterium]
MFSKLARIILAFTCFPLLGAYSLRWVGAYSADLAGLAGINAAGLPLMDIAGAMIGFILGLLLAIQVVGCCLQPEISPVRPAGDSILIILALNLVINVILPRVLGDAAAIMWLPPLTLAIWAGCGAATLSLARMRRHYREQQVHPVEPPL